MSNRQDNPVIVLGAGGHAAVLIDCLRRLGVNILGLTDVQKPKGERILGVEVLGTDDEIFSYKANDICLVNGIGITEHSSSRHQLACRMRQAGFAFRTIIDPTAIVLSDIEVGDGVQILAGVVIQPRVSIGQDSIINTGVLVDHDCMIEAECHICPGVTLAGSVTVGSQTMIGTGSTVVPGISIGNNSTIAAASVIYNDVPANVNVIQHRYESLGASE